MHPAPGTQHAALRLELPIVSSVAVAVAALAGAFVAGDSVRASLRDLALERIGRAAFAIEAPEFVREALAGDVAAAPGFSAAYGRTSPIVALDGFVTNDASGRRSFGVDVFGVDDRFWRLHGRDVTAPQTNEAYLSEALARELGAAPGDGLLVGMAKQPVIPAESLFGRRDDLARSLKLTLKAVLPASDRGDFSLRVSQAPVRAIFVPLGRLQRALDRQRQINLILVSERERETRGEERGTKNEERGGVGARPEDLLRLVRQAMTLDDIGVTVRPLAGRDEVAVESASGILSDEVAADAERAAATLGLTARPVLSYPVGSITFGDRRIPYSFVTATDLQPITAAVGPAGLKSGATTNRRPSTRSGARVPSSESSTRSSSLIPRSLSQSPISNQQSPISNQQGGTLDDPVIVLTDWAARRLGARAGDTVWLSYSLWADAGRLQGEMARFRVAAIVPLVEDRDLVPESPGISGAERVADWDPPFPIDPAEFTQSDEDYWRSHNTTPKAFIALDVGQRMWGSRHGRVTSVRVATTTLAVEALAAHYRDRLRAEHGRASLTVRVRAVRAGALAAARGTRSFGWLVAAWSAFFVLAGLLLAALWMDGGPRPVRDAAALAVAGGVMGLLGTFAYAALVLHGLRTWWIDAVGTTALSLHAPPVSALLAAGAGCSLAFVVLAIAAARATRARPFAPAGHDGGPPRPRLVIPLAMTILAGLATPGFIAVSLAELVDLERGFLGAGAAVLVGALSYYTFRLRRHGEGTMVRVVVIVASSLFTVLAVNALKQGSGRAAVDRRSGDGGYPLVAESTVPVLHDLDTTEGQKAIGLSLPLDLPLSSARFTRFRVRHGDDVSRRNVYRPIDPRMLGARPDFIERARFAFAGSLAETPDEQQNPWRLLDRDLAGGAVPVVADAAAMRDVLHLSLGGEITTLDSRGAPVTLRIVGALAASVLESDLVMAERHFTRLFPDIEGSRAFLIEVEPRWAPALASRLEAQLGHLGFRTTASAERLRSFSGVTDASLSAFQALSALGLLAGIVGFAAAEFGRARAERGAPALAVLVEVGWQVCAGLTIGAAAGLVGLAPTVIGRAFYN